MEGAVVNRSSRLHSTTPLSVGQLLMLGLDVIPVQPGDKRPACAAWQNIPPSDQWRGMTDRYNFGLRMGGAHGLAAADGDDRRAVENIRRGLVGLGLDCPTVLTPHGRHFYLRVENPPGGDTRLLRPEVGKGELRFGRGSFVVLPPSTVDGRRYRFLRGARAADLLTSPLVAWSDLAWLVDTRASAAAALPVNLARYPLSSKVLCLFETLHAAQKGEAVGGYPSRSEAEAFIVSSMILHGWPFEDIRAEFERWQPGHFAQHAKPDDYLRAMYHKCIAHLASSDDAKEIAEMYRAALSVPWPGRGGGNDRAAYLGLLSIAFVSNRPAYAVTASERSVAEQAAMSAHGAHNALMRLGQTGLVNRLVIGGESGSVFKVQPVNSGANLTVASSLLTLTVRFAPVLTPSELWSQAHLGKSAGMVYSHLSDSPLSVSDLMSFTGKSRNTVKAALRRLDSCGLACEVEGGWTKGKTDIRQAAREWDCDRAAQERQAKHRRQRSAWRAASISVRMTQSR